MSCGIGNKKLTANAYLSRFIVISDNLAGSNDCGLQFRKHGLSTITIFNKDYLNNTGIYEATVINSETRGISKEEAYAKLFEIGQSIKEYADSHIIFKKIDSNLRGNIVSELKALDDSINPEIVVFAPAHPDNMRTTVHGIHYLNGIPVDKTELARKPQNPVLTSDICALLNKNSYMNFTHIDIKSIRNNDVISIVQNSDKKYFSFDASEVEDLNIIVRFINSLNKRVLWVGSSGLAEILAIFVCSEISRSCPALAVIGSIDSASAIQAYRALDSKTTAGAEVNIERVILRPEDEKQRLLKNIIGKMDKGFDILLTSALDSSKIITASSIGKRMGIPLCEVSNKIAGFLGTITYEILNTRKVSGLFLTGGGTAVSIIEGLSAKGSIVIEELDTCIPVVSLIGGPFEGLKIISKPGYLGDNDIILNAINYLRKRK